MPGVTTTDRPFLTKKDGASAVCAIRESSDRSPRAGYSLPDYLWLIRTADWLTAFRTQPRPADSQPADGGTIFFETDESAQEFQSDPGLPSIEDKRWTEQRVVLWMRADDPTLRSVAIGRTTLALNTQLILDKCPQTAPGSPDAAETMFPLHVWTLWTNPFAE